jgi:hypothetical protein
MLSRSTTGRLTTTVKKEIKKEPEIIATKISSRLNQKVVAPLGNKKHSTVFSSVYSRGGIPCRLIHGSVKHKVQWSVEITRLDYNPVLVTFFEGLRETQHPFKNLVEYGLMELIQAENAIEKVIALLPNISVPLRNALAQQNKVF